MFWSSHQKVHDVEVNYFTCGFTCHFFFLFVFKLYAYVFTCATSKLFSQVKLHVKPRVKSFTSTSRTPVTKEGGVFVQLFSSEFFFFFFFCRFAASS